VRSYDSPDRRVKGTPDAPYSLYEGLCGEIYFISDLLNDEDLVRFPSYEI
jgi:hypothetical protein